MEPLIDHDYFQGAVREVQMGPKPPNVWLKITQLAVVSRFGCSWLDYWKSSWHLIGSISYPDKIGVQNTLNGSQYLEKSAPRLAPQFQKFFFLFFLAFLALFEVSDASFGVFVVSITFYNIPWHIRSPEQLESLL